METWQWELLDPGPEPDISIVICVYGKTQMTLNCIKAIHDAQNVNLARAEVIVVDDKSPDDVLEKMLEIKGLKVVANEENLGFLRSANAGVRVARGRNVLFLNNDTLPMGRWLDPLLDLFDRRPRAMAVGSKLVFADGVLQEAGGIIWSDGSGWNIGRNQDPHDPRFTYERQVDYCSGASLMVRGDFLRNRGGFDEQYVPAYYEDTDLCFAVREAGGEVWVQPTSIVVHLEGQSHGTDIGTGIKAYQQTNRLKFMERWKTALDRQFAPDAINVPLAMQRATKRIVVFENEVPTPDRDSGSVRMWAILESLSRMGFSITFVPLNTWRREPYTARLENMGVCVMGETEPTWTHLEQIAEGVTHVWISRPHVADAVLGRARQVFRNAAFIYDTVDLHFLRLEREAELTKSAQTGLEAARFRAQELQIISGSDVVVVVSDFEQGVLGCLTQTPVALVPNIHDVPIGRISASNRRDLVFVGGFRHGPNEDAVLWFANEVWPSVFKEFPDTRFKVVGSHPTPAILELAVPGIEILGWVPDLAPIYAKARLAIAPLRFGAGVKGKVGEAMSLGVPMVMTSIAAEGMGIAHDIHAAVADDAEAFAAEICSLLSDDERWIRLADTGRSHIEEAFGIAAVHALVEQSIDVATQRRAVRS